MSCFLSGSSASHTCSWFSSLSNMSFTLSLNLLMPSLIMIWVINMFTCGFASLFSPAQCVFLISSSGSGPKIAAMISWYCRPSCHCFLELFLSSFWVRIYLCSVHLIYHIHVVNCHVCVLFFNRYAVIVFLIIMWIWIAVFSWILAFVVFMSQSCDFTVICVVCGLLCVLHIALVNYDVFCSHSCNFHIATIICVFVWVIVISLLYFHLKNHHQFQVHG